MRAWRWLGCRNILSMHLRLFGNGTGPDVIWQTILIAIDSRELLVLLLNRSLYRSSDWSLVRGRRWLHFIYQKKSYKLESHNITGRRGVINTFVQPAQLVRLTYPSRRHRATCAPRLASTREWARLVLLWVLSWTWLRWLPFLISMIHHPFYLFTDYNI